MPPSSSELHHCPVIDVNFQASGDAQSQGIDAGSSHHREHPDHELVLRVIEIPYGHNACPEIRIRADGTPSPGVTMQTHINGRPCKVAKLASTYNDNLPHNGDSSSDNNAPRLSTRDKGKGKAVDVPDPGEGGKQPNHVDQPGPSYDPKGKGRAVDIPSPGHDGKQSKHQDHPGPSHDPKGKGKGKKVHFDNPQYDSNGGKHSTHQEASTSQRHGHEGHSTRPDPPASPRRSDSARCAPNHPATSSRHNIAKAGDHAHCSHSGHQNNDRSHSPAPAPATVQLRPRTLAPRPSHGSNVNPAPPRPQHTVLYGNNLCIARSDCTVYGNDCRLIGDHCGIFGNDGAILGHYGKIVGNDGRIDGDYGSIVGNDGRVTGLDGWICGNYGVVRGPRRRS